MIRTGYLLVGPDAYRIATRYLNEWDLAVTEPPHIVALTDHLPAGGHQAFLIDLVKAGVETVPIEVDLPEHYSWTRYGFSVDPTVIRVRQGFLPARPVSAAAGEAQPPTVGHG